MSRQAGRQVTHGCGWELALELAQRDVVWPKVVTPLALLGRRGGAGVVRRRNRETKRHRRTDGQILLGISRQDNSGRLGAM